MKKKSIILLIITILMPLHRYAQKEEKKLTINDFNKYFTGLVEVIKKKGKEIQGISIDLVNNAEYYAKTKNYLKFYELTDIVWQTGILTRDLDFLMRLTELTNSAFKHGNIQNTLIALARQADRTLKFRETFSKTLNKLFPTIDNKSDLFLIDKLRNSLKNGAIWDEVKRLKALNKK